MSCFFVKLIFILTATTARSGFPLVVATAAQLEFIGQHRRVPETLPSEVRGFL